MVETSNGRLSLQVGEIDLSLGVSNLILLAASLVPDVSTISLPELQTLGCGQECPPQLGVDALMPLASLFALPAQPTSLGTE